MKKILRGAIVLLIAIAMVFSTVAVTADTLQEEKELEMDSSSLKSTNTNPSEPIIEPALGPVGFSQPPPEEDDPWGFYTSDSGLAYLCMDDFVGLTADIFDIHWWGLSLIFDGGWYACDPTGMVFEIIFYDMNMNPVCSYTNLIPTAQPTGKFFSGFEMYKWELDLDPGCSLTDGWVSIQSISSPNGCSFLWANSLTGDLNAMQNGASLGDNLAFELTYKKSRDITSPFLNFLQNHPNMFPLLQVFLQRLDLI
jgi:hypothetical protein